jgi:putative sigma-54 modulation protein
MKLTYTGKQEKLSPVLEKKVAAKLGRLSKVLDPRGQKDANVVFSSQRHLQHAEVTVYHYDHALVAVGSATDQGTALLDSLEKLEKQALKMRGRWRDIKRTPESKAAAGPRTARPAQPAKPAKTVRAAAKPNGKPMTLDEAMLNIEEEQDYMVYRDSETDRNAVLVRLRDGSFRRVEP